MKKNILEFIRRGLIASGFGPLALVIIYLIFQKQLQIETVTVNQVCTGIVSLWCLAFIAGGMNVVYKIERLPLMLAILIHGVVLYISYLAVYLVNGWLESGKTSVWIFTVIFVVCYLIIWVIIYLITKRNTTKINQILKEKQQDEEKMLSLK